MRAFVIPGARHDSVQLGHVPVPRVGPSELLVRVKAVGVGIHDSYFLPPDISYPYPIGIEAAGVIDEVGSAVPGHRSGERIAFVSSMQQKGGTWAEYAIVRGDSLIVPIPEGLSFEQAAAVPVAGNTTLRAFHALAPIPAGGSIFVAGASGAIGTFVVQLARAKGWEVAASASARNHDYLASLGATKTVDYHDEHWPEEIRQWRSAGVDAALAVQPQTTADSLAVVKDGGTVVTISGDRVIPARGVKVVAPSYEVDVRGELVALMEQIASGQVRLVIEHVYPFDEALAALAKVQTRRARGKVVLSLT
ncbi:MAG: NADP-dependent oxidoreductase [Micrococcales bacterium]|nr:NADP-dependent oxidoreductase [Micrococcales bacterium]